MPVKMGARWSTNLFVAMLIVPYLLVGAAIAIDSRFIPLLAVIFTLPSSLSTIAGIRRESGDFTSLSRQAGQMILPLRVIKLHLRFCFLLLAGCLVAAYFRMC